jgi:hypothetical protein
MQAAEHLELSLAALWCLEHPDEFGLAVGQDLQLLRGRLEVARQAGFHVLLEISPVVEGVHGLLFLFVKGLWRPRLSAADMDRV